MSELILDRRAVLSRILQDRDGALIVTGLGSPVWDLSSLDERPENFHLWAGMGLACVTGLGLALAQPDKRVWVVTGDGEMLMGVGSFATIATAASPAPRPRGWDAPPLWRPGSPSAAPAGGSTTTISRRVRLSFLPTLQ